jgi:hypothetical protein
MFGSPYVLPTASYSRYLRDLLQGLVHTLFDVIKEIAQDDFFLCPE